MFSYKLSLMETMQNSPVNKLAIAYVFPSLTTPWLDLFVNHVKLLLN
jgi:hypothetical protein